MSMGSAAPAGAVDNVVARIERLPTSWWHVKTRIIVGVATFFDAFDAIAIATVLPVLAPLWKLSGPDIGFMISAGYVGQLIGALLFGWIGERYGRMPAMIGSIALFGVMSLVCAFAWDYNSLLWFRTLHPWHSAWRWPRKAATWQSPGGAKRRCAMRPPHGPAIRRCSHTPSTWPIAKASPSCSPNAARSIMSSSPRRNCAPARSRR